MKLLLLGLFFSGCVPTYLDKYQSLPPQPTSQSQPYAVQKRVISTDQQSFVFQSRFNHVWETAIRVLIKNYNITIVDQKSGIITTEWDSFYLKDRLFRNKVSVHITSLKNGDTEVSLFNNMETVADIKSHASMSWVPYQSPDLDEIKRLIHNMAISLNLTPPGEISVAKGVNEKKAL